jgi:hypothetical protein
MILFRFYLKNSKGTVFSCPLVIELRLKYTVPVTHQLALPDSPLSYSDSNASHSSPEVAVFARVIFFFRTVHN